MAERLTELRVWQVTVTCDTCDVPVIFTGRVYDSLPPKYPHVCPRCQAEVMLADISPFLRHSPR